MNNDTNTTEEIKSMLEMSGKGYPKPSLSNCKLILNTDPNLKGAIRHNAMSCKDEIVRNMWWHRDGKAISDTDVTYIKCYLEETYGISNEKNIRDSIIMVSNDNRFHPVIDYLNSLTWDGNERIRKALHHFLGADESDLTYESLKLMMLRAVSRAFHPGCKFDTMLCLVGGQGVGKSTFFRFLAHDDRWFSDDIRNLADDKVFQRLQGHWIIEMSEMTATTNAKSIEDIKSFIGRQSDNYKLPYAIHAMDWPRQCIFAGTSNKMQFLPADRSGNRRFLPIQCNGNNAEVHILNNPAESRAYIDQMWAEIMTIYNSGDYCLTLDKEMSSALAEYQQNYVPEDSDEAAINGYLDDITDYDTHVCAKQLFYDALGRPENAVPKSWELNAINEILASRPDWERGPHHRFGYGIGTQRSWIKRRPVPKNIKEEFLPLISYDQEELPFF